MKALVLSIALAMSLADPAAASYPVSVRSCSATVTFDGPPRRALVNSLNMIQTVIDLGLIDRIVGVSNSRWFAQNIVAAPAVMQRLQQIQFSETSASLEAVLAQNPDFYFAGWQYGFTEASGVTPQRLAQLGIKTYALNESCIRIHDRPSITMDTLYTDIDALGRIFDVTARAGSLIDALRRRVEAVTTRTAKAPSRRRVMYCGNCSSDAPPTSIGAEGMPKLLMKLAGGQNIFDDVNDSYVRVSWEDVIARDPEWILISVHPTPADDTVRYLTTNPLLQNITAIRKRQFVFVTYPERSPSTRSVDALERLARAMHPGLFGP